MANGHSGPRGILSVLFMFLAIGIICVVLFLAGCAKDRYSQDEETARIQKLDDFCLLYSKTRDQATHFILVDSLRNEPILTSSMIDGFETARQFIRPFCSPEFDPLTDTFDLNRLRQELQKIRLILLQQEGTAWVSQPVSLA